MHEILHAYDKFTHASHLQITKSVELQREKIKGQDYELVLIALKSQQKFSIVLQKKLQKCDKITHKIQQKILQK